MTSTKASIRRSDFGTTASGEAVSLFTLVNTNGMKAEVINYGGIIRSLIAPDRKGLFENVVLA